MTEPKHDLRNMPPTKTPTKTPIEAPGDEKGEVVSVAKAEPAPDPIAEAPKSEPPKSETPQAPATLLQVKDLTIKKAGASRAALENFSLTLEPGARVVVLGEGGCGREALLRALGGVAEKGETASGTIQFRANPPRLLARNTKIELRTAFLPGPYSAVLNAHVSVLSQLTLIVARKLGQSRAIAHTELTLALQRLSGAPTPDALDMAPALVAPEALAVAFLAAALAQTPELLIADDPLTQLSPAHARAFAGLLLAEQARLGFALIYAAASVESAKLMGGDLIVLRNGAVVEEGPVSRLATASAQVYTQTLFRSASSLAGDQLPQPARGAQRGDALLQVQGVTLDQSKRARDALSFELRRGASLALIGEQGSGRRALARALLGLDPVSSGRVVFDQVDIGILNDRMLSRLRRRVAFVTGDDDALDPRLTIFDTVSEPLRAHLRMPREGVARNRDAALKRVGLAALSGQRSVASLSPFDRRRLQIARAIVSAPLLAVIDEPLRGLDAFAQAVMRDLLRSLRSQEAPAFLVITSDFGLAQAFCEEAFVFKDGRVVERGPIAAMLRAPKDSQTKKLIGAVAAAPPNGLSPAPPQG